MLLLRSSIQNVLRIGLMNRMGGVNEFASLVPVTGQTLVTGKREWFDTDVTSGSPGIFSAVTGQITGGLTRGPRTAAHPTRRSGAARFPTTAERAANTDMFRGEIVASSVDGGLTSIHWGCWYRPSFGVGGTLTSNNPLNNTILSYRTYTGVNADYWVAAIATIWKESTNQIILQFYGGDGVVTDDTPISLDAEQWIYLALVVIDTSGAGSPRNYTIKAWYKTLTGSPTVFGTNAATSPYDTAVNKVFCEQRIIASGGGPVGRIASVQLYNLSGANDAAKLAAGLLYPTDLGPPVEARQTFSMDTTGTGTALEGPFAAPSELITARRNIVFLGAKVPWRADDTTVIAASTFTFTTINTTIGADTTTGTYTNLSKRLGTEYRTNSNYLAPQGDTLSIEPGNYYFTANAEGDFGLIKGIDIRASSATKPVFYLDKILGASVANWDAVDTNVWGTSDPNAASDLAGVWQSDGVGGWLPLYPVRVADQTIATAGVKAIEGSYWSVDATGTGIVVHPYGNVDAGTVQWRFGGDFLTNTGADTFDGFRIADGRVKDIAFRGGLQYRTVSESQSLYSRYHAGGADGFAFGYFAIFDGLEGAEYGKHAFGCGPQNTRRAVVITKGAVTTSGPVTYKSAGGVITAATAANPSVITCAGHGLQTGYPVIISGATGNTSINGTWNVTTSGADTFSVPVLGNGVYAGSGEVVSPVGFGSGAWQAFALHSGNEAASIAFDGVVALVYDCVDRPNVAVVGSITPTYDATRGSMIVHNTSGAGQFAYVAFFGNDFTDSQANYLISAGATVQAYDTGA